MPGGRRTSQGSEKVWSVSLSCRLSSRSAMVALQAALEAPEHVCEQLAALAGFTMR